MRLLLEASIRVREGALAEAAALLDQAEEQRPKVVGTCDGQPFEDFRDLDDLTACVLEVLTSNGKYYWVPIAQVESIEFHEPARPRDLLWRRTHLIVRDGPDGEVFLPALYPGAAAEADDLIRLGPRDRLARRRRRRRSAGVGQRTFLVGDEATPDPGARDRHVRRLRVQRSATASSTSRCIGAVDAGQSTGMPCPRSEPINRCSRRSSTA